MALPHDGWDAITLEHQTEGMPFMVKEDCPVGFLPTHPLKNDPEASVYTTPLPPINYFWPWYMKDPDER